MWSLLKSLISIFQYNCIIECMNEFRAVKKIVWSLVPPSGIDPGYDLWHKVDGSWCPGAVTLAVTIMPAILQLSIITEWVALGNTHHTTRLNYRNEGRPHLDNSGWRVATHSFSVSERNIIPNKGFDISRNVRKFHRKKMWKTKAITGALKLDGNSRTRHESGNDERQSLQKK